MKEINKSEPTSYTININMRCIEIPHKDQDVF